MNSESNSGIGTLLKRELVRTALERAQTLDVAKLTELVGRNADVLYEDVEESLNIPYINREEIPLAMDVLSRRVPKRLRCR